MKPVEDEAVLGHRVRTQAPRPKVPSNVAGGRTHMTDLCSVSSWIDWPRNHAEQAATSLPLPQGGTGCPLQRPRRGGSTHQARARDRKSSPNSNEAACKEERAGGAPSFASRMAPPTLSPPTTPTKNSSAHYRKFHRGERCRQRRPNPYQCLSRSARRPTDLLQMRAIKLASSRGVQHVGDLEDDFTSGFTVTLTQKYSAMSPVKFPMRMMHMFVCCHAVISNTT